jgi:predicted aspartyl protease
MPVKGLSKVGTIKGGHPYIDILVSADGKASAKYTALIDTGYSGFVSIPLMEASALGLKAQTTIQYTLADGKTLAIPHALGHACVEGDPFVEGLIAFSENASALVGVDFLTRCGHILMMSSKGISLVNEKGLEAAIKELTDATKQAAEGARDAAESAAKHQSKSA